MPTTIIFDSEPVTFTVKVGDIEIVHSGCLLAKVDEAVSLQIQDLIFDLTFPTDSGPARLEGEIVNDRMVFKIYNANGAFPQANYPNDFIAQINDRKIYMYLVTTQIGKTLRKIDYSIGVEVKNG